MCPICMTQKVMKGKWKLPIIWLLKDNTLRFSEIQKSIPNVTQTYLSKQLKSLENDQLVIRKSYNQIPPKVEYSLSATGKDFIKVLDYMNVWGISYIQKYIMPLREE
ncbi:MAG: helix-turn-helix transcriptional regulator [Peptostreptococcaceae bacterium]|nr:helix-turn-helix transcriptional regulator [Peptostreptococcaceae bacterium]